MKSILQEEKKCYMCGTTNWLEEHHIFGGANRKKSEKYGLKVWLCHNCHNEAPYGVHHNKDNMLWLHQEGQKAYMFFYEKSKEDFAKLFYRNYL